AAKDKRPFRRRTYLCFRSRFEADKIPDVPLVDFHRCRRWGLARKQLAHMSIQAQLVSLEVTVILCARFDVLDDAPTRLRRHRGPLPRVAPVASYSEVGVISRG